MKIIGEKINGTRKRVAQAIADRDVEYIQNLAVRQAEAGAVWLDVNAGTHPSHEPDDLTWLVETIQSVVETPLCLDSANPEALKAAIQSVDKTPMINSISGEQDRLYSILPLVAEHNCQVIALALTGNQIPNTSQERLEVIRIVMGETRALGVPDEHVYIDCLAMTIATNTQGALVTFQSMQSVKQEFPETHLTIGLSNISFGMPARSYINRCFLTLAMQAGLDSAILDPLDQDLQAAILAAELLLGKDENCLKYIRASRKGIFN